MVDEREVAEATELALLMPLLNADDSGSWCEVGVGLAEKSRVCGVNCAFCAAAARSCANSAASALSSASRCVRGMPGCFSVVCVLPADEGLDMLDGET